MQILAKKTNRLLPFASFALFITGAALLSLGQEPPTPAAPAVAPSAPPVAPAPAETKPVSPKVPELPSEKSTQPTGAAALDYLYNRKPQEGTAAKQAVDVGQRAQEKAIVVDALGVSRIEDPQLRAQFQKYLALPEVGQDQLGAYHARIGQVMGLLQQRKPFDAWKHLFALAEYSTIDAGVSRELANRIESIWSTDRASSGLARQNESLRGEIKGTSRNADMLAEDVRGKEVDYQRRLSQNRDASKQREPQKNNGEAPPGAGNKAGAISASPSIDAVIGKLQLTDAYLQTIEAKARIKLNELKTDALLDQAKSNFAKYIGTLFQSGRHRHVVIAADFYRRLFDASEYPVAMAEQVNVALEMAREVEGAVEVVKSKLEEKQIAAAASQLQQAFMMNPLHPALLGLKRSQKSKVEAFSSAVDKMRNLMEAREFTDLEVLLSELKVSTPDFDATKAKAIINAVKLQGQLRLGKAKLAAQQGDLKAAMEEFQAAAEVWPSNPALQDKALTFFDSQDIQSQSLREFDRLVKEGSYRGIFEKQLAFAPAMKDDKDRQEQLKQALEKVKIAEMAIEKANLLRVNGDVFGAWETVEFAVTELPNDNKLNMLRGELSGRGAEFVAAINRAKEAEARKELGYSLTWYALAQRHYPASQMANKAIERLSEEILNRAAL